MRIGSCNARIVVFLAIVCFGRGEAVAADAAQEHAAPTTLDLCGTPAEIGARWGTVNRQAIRRALERYLAKAKTEKLSEKTLIKRAGDLWKSSRGSRRTGSRRLAPSPPPQDSRGPLPVVLGKRAAWYRIPRMHLLCRGQGVHARPRRLLPQNRDNVDCEQAAYVLASSVTGVNKLIAITNASAVNCSMMVNDKGLAGSGDYPAHLTRKGDPHALLPEAAEPRFRGMMNDFLLRHIAERAADCSQALNVIQDFANSWRDRPMQTSNGWPARSPAC